MIDVIGTIFIGASLALILAAVVEFAALAREAKFVLAAASGAWVGLAAAAVAAGMLTNPLTTLTLFGAPLLAIGLALAMPGVRRATGAIPLPALVGLNAVRLGGVAFVLLALEGNLAGPFPYLAGWGDFITGALAIPVALAAARPGAKPGAPLLAWNAFGMLDLLVAVTLGLISRNGSPVQLIHAGVGTAALQHLPWALVPTVLVPFFLVVHAAIFVRIAAATRSPAHRLGPELGHAHR